MRTSRRRPATWQTRPCLSVPIRRRRTMKGPYPSHTNRSDATSVSRNSSSNILGAKPLSLPLPLLLSHPPPSPFAAASPSFSRSSFSRSASISSSHSASASRLLRSTGASYANHRRDAASSTRACSLVSSLRLTASFSGVLPSGKSRRRGGVVAASSSRVVGGARPTPRDCFSVCSMCSALRKAPPRDESRGGRGGGGGGGGGEEDVDGSGVEVVVLCAFSSSSSSCFARRAAISTSRSATL
mmetsp:Transcript_11310/g.28649  ORF Transcript_11310/g.28649 Transcript_11310/m.28649 type:complete len:242 (+) Transcript_11310:291-1016(+)